MQLQEATFSVKGSKFWKKRPRMAQDGPCIYFSWGEAWLHRPRPPSHVSEVSKKRFRFLMLHLNSFDIIQFCYQLEGLRKCSGTAWTALGIVQFD